MFVCLGADKDRIFCDALNSSLVSSLQALGNVQMYTNVWRMLDACVIGLICNLTENFQRAALANEYANEYRKCKHGTLLIYI